MPAAALRQSAPSAPPHQDESPPHRSAGQRLLAAFEALEQFPVYAGARASLRGPGADTAAIVEADLALTLAVLREANRGTERTRIATVPDALDRVGELGLHAIVATAASYDFFEPAGSWGAIPQGYRLHAQATQRAADRLARALHYRRRDELRVAALVHDVGKLVLVNASPDYWELRGPAVRSPERRIERERRELGVDHAVVGGVLARRWGFPDLLARAIERHHHDDAEDLAAMTRLADLIARFEAGNTVDTKVMRRIAAELGLDTPALRDLLAGATDAPPGERRSRQPCPLTPGEHRVVSELAKGHVYKEIAAGLNLSVSTVRTHLYNTYRKLGVTDRAQAILLAKDNGWI
jgi:putative nucleotidyltransferase with HDIG domain